MIVRMVILTIIQYYLTILHFLPTACCPSQAAGQSYHGNGNTSSTPTPVLEKNDHDRFLPKHAKNADLTPSFQLVKPHLVNT